MIETPGADAVEVALAAIARRDRDDADAARAAFDSLTWSQGLDSVTMFGLCDWLWYQLLPFHRE